jgi:glycogen debranching enzyme
MERLRTLAPAHADYKPRYYGDLRARDAAYHQGTVWPWLIGPFIDAWITAHPEEPRIRPWGPSVWPGFLSPLQKLARWITSRDSLFSTFRK